MRGLETRTLEDRTLGAVSPIPPGATWWVRAQDLSTSPVTTWPDISGNGNDFTQPTAANQPTLVDGVQNGYPGVLFDGSDDWLGSNISTPQPVTWAAAAIPVAGANNDTVIGSRDQASTTDPGAVFYITNSVFTVFAGANQISPVAGSTPVRFAVTFNGGTSRRYINNSAGIVNPGTRGPGLITLGAFISTGTSRSGFGNYYILEAIGWSRALNDTELQSVMAYFADKYAM